LRKILKPVKFFKNPIHPPLDFWPLFSHSAAWYQHNSHARSQPYNPKSMC